MNRLKIYPLSLTRNIVLIATFLAGLIVTMQAPHPTFALPRFDSIAVINNCTLPDGSKGQLVSPNGNGLETCCPPGATDSTSCLYGKYINPAINLLAALVGIVVVIGIVFGAIEYTTSQGDPQRAASGKKRITNALVALVAFLLLYAFLQFIVPGGIAHG